MPRFLALLALLLLLPVGALAAGLAPAQGPGPSPADDAPGAYIMRIDGPLDAGHQALFKRAAARAKADDALLVIGFDTPGGELTRMRQLAAAVDEAVEDGVRIIGWVDDEALSAGTWIAIACESLFVRERSTIGAAQAVMITPGGLVPAEEKIASAYRAWVRAWAESHGRDPLLAQAMIDPGTEVRSVRVDGVETLISGGEWNDLAARGEPPELISTVVKEGELWALTGTQAIRYGFADAIAETIDEVLAKQGLAGTKVAPIDKTRSEDLLASLHGMRLLLLFLGLFFGYVELKVPGFGVPGIVSLVCFGILFAGQYMVGLADVPHLVLAVLGMGLVAAELFVLPGMIWPGLIGASMLIVALLLGQVGPGMSLGDAWDRLILFDATFQLVATAATAVLAIWLISRFLPETPILSRLVLAGGPATEADAMPEAHEPEHTAHARVGATGVTRSTLRPVGKVVLDGDHAGVEHEARSESGVIESGARIVVVEVHAGRLLVREGAAGA